MFYVLDGFFRFVSGCARSLTSTLRSDSTQTYVSLGIASFKSSAEDDNFTIISDDDDKTHLRTNVCQIAGIDPMNVILCLRVAVRKVKSVRQEELKSELY